MRAHDISRPAARRLLVVSLAALVAIVPMGAPAEAITPKEKKLIKLVNAYRAKKGKASLKTSEKLSKLAHKHSKGMAANGGWFHSTSGQLLSYMQKAGCDSSIGENVAGYPGKVSGVHQAFIDSPPHRKQMLKGYWKKMGAGIVVDDTGWMWATELFCH
jgi:uncharacterized protein YkwD